jgi:acyl-CoA synthetase (AMP-forming)/AMP-acid ligase II
VPNGSVFTPYGATEALPVSCISAKEVLKDTYKKTLQGYGTCVGHAINGIRIRILPITDAEFEFLPDGLKIGEIGEIAVSAPYISKRYLNDDAATKKTKIRDGNGMIWHRMGDVGYLDEMERLWFCGRKTERVLTEKQTFYTDCCEPIFNTHKIVFRSALIAFTANNKVVPAIIIDPKINLSRNETNCLFRELRSLAQSCPVTSQICHFGIYKNFPVDVRHNAKIHRLTLMRYFAKHKQYIQSIDA